MAHDNHSLAERLNTLVQEFHIPGNFTTSVNSTGRLVVKKGNRPSTKSVLEQALRKIGIVATDSIAGNLKGYENAYKEFERRDGVVLRKGDAVYFHQHRAVIEGFRALRNDAAILLPFRDFLIEVDPRKLSFTETPPQAQPAAKKRTTAQEVPQHAEDCPDIRQENTELRRELEACRQEVDLCKEENDFFREEYGELPQEILEEMPEVQRQQMKEEITETLTRISTAYEQLDKPEARRQEQHLKELVKEVTEQVASSTVQATADCVVRENHIKNGVEIVFPQEPDSSVKKQLNTLGFHYHRKGKYWYAKKTDKRMEFATSLCSSSGEAVPRTAQTAAKKQAAISFEPPPTTNVNNGVYMHHLYGEAKKVLQAKLRHIFPGVKFSIASRSTSSLTITAYDVSQTDKKRIEEVVGRFGQLGFDGMTDSTVYYRGEPFREEDGTLHRYVTASYLSIYVKGKSSTDKTSPDYKKHFAEPPSPASGTVQPEPKTGSEDQKKSAPYKPSASIDIEHPTSDTIYIHRISAKEAAEIIPQKLHEMFPSMRFWTTFMPNTNRILTNLGEGILEIWVDAASKTDIVRLEKVVRRFTDSSPDVNELLNKQTHTAFVEKGQRNRYLVNCTIRVMHQRLVDEDQTYPDYIYHFSEEYPMQTPAFIEVPSSTTEAHIPDSYHSEEEDFLPAPQAEPKPKPEPESEPEPIAPEPFPEPEPVKPQSDVRSAIAEMREALMAAINLKKGAA